MPGHQSKTVTHLGGLYAIESNVCGKPTQRSLVPFPVEHEVERQGPAFDHHQAVRLWTLEGIGQTREPPDALHPCHVQFSDILLGMIMLLDPCHFKKPIRFSTQATGSWELGNRKASEHSCQPRGTHLVLHAFWSWDPRSGS